MEIIDIKVEENGHLKGITVFLKGVDGEIVKAEFKKKIARNLMRAIFLRLGVDPRLTGMDMVVEAEQEKKERIRREEQGIS